MKIGFIGVGKMATAIIKGLQQSQADIIISGRNLESSQAKAQELGIAYAQSHQDLIAKSDLVILGVKPQSLEDLLANLNLTKPLVSMCAGVTLEKLTQLTSPDLPIIRIMPNINAQSLQSTTGVCPNDLVSEELLASIMDLTDSFGTSFLLKEKDFDAFTALAGSSPAYMLTLIEAFALAGVKYGLSKQESLKIVSQTMVATAQNLLQSNLNPTDIIEQIASPGGLTIAGLLDLEKTGFRASAISAIDATVQKSKHF